MKTKLEILVDGFQVYGPKQTDGSYTIKLTTGEYEKLNVAKLLAIPYDSNLKITIEILD